MPYALNNVTTQDDYTPGTTLQCPGAERFNITVANAAVYVSFGVTPGLPSGAQQGAEFFRVPGIYSMDRKAATVAVRSAAAGATAQVTIDAWRKGELA